MMNKGQGVSRRARDILRIGISLIDAAGGFDRRSQTFDRTMEDISTGRISI